MAIVECRECKKEVSDEAPNCPHCGVVTPSEEKISYQEYANEAAMREANIERWLDKAWKIGLGLVIVWFIFSGKAAEFFRKFGNEVIAACTVESLNLDSDIFITNGEADAGVRATALIRKEKRDGNVTVSVTISSSEGDLTKERTVHMTENQRANVVLQFPEPTINAINITGQAKCSTL
jgi:hypothetical protein